MKDKLLIFLGLALLIIVLVGLNALSYVQKETLPDTEINPNRSTYNVGATGTRAFYDLLAETGRRPSRWNEPPSALLRYGIDDPATFVIVGSVRREFSESELESLLRWVSNGGRLVVIDRDPPEELIRTTAAWKIATVPGELPRIDTDPSDQKQMTSGTAASKPVQPTIMTAQVNAVQTSRFASSVSFEPVTVAPPPVNEDDLTSDPPRTGAPVADPETIIPEDETETGNLAETTEMPPAEKGPDESAEFDAPVVHLAGNEKKLLVDFPYGSGQIAFLTDPYVVSNSGIGLVDNSRIAVNLVAAKGGAIVFDEYHQGYGANNNPLVNYFEGTPVVSLVFQFAVLIGLVLFARSRRFARPLPAAEPNRLSKLEYISAMAALQSRTRAFDLAVENVYKEFRRRAAKLVGVDNLTTSRENLAKLISERSGLNAGEIDEMMFKCEEITYGEPTNRKEVVELVGRLRETETTLGLLRKKDGRN